MLMIIANVSDAIMMLVLVQSNRYLPLQLERATCSAINYARFEDFRQNNGNGTEGNRKKAT